MIEIGISARIADDAHHRSIECWMDLHLHEDLPAVRLGASKPESDRIGLAPGQFRI